MFGEDRVKPLQTEMGDGRISKVMKQKSAKNRSETEMKRTKSVSQFVFLFVDFHGYYFDAYVRAYIGHVGH